MARIYTFLFYIILCCIAVVNDTSCQVPQALIYVVTSNLAGVIIFRKSIRAFDKVMQGLRSSIHRTNEYPLPLKFYMKTRHFTRKKAIEHLPSLNIGRR